MLVPRPDWRRARPHGKDTASRCRNRARLPRPLEARRRASPGLFKLGDADYARLTGKLFDVIASSNPPSNAYTMLGMLPNLAAGRVLEPLRSQRPEHGDRRRHSNRGGGRSNGGALACLRQFGHRVGGRTAHRYAAPPVARGRRQRNSNGDGPVSHEGVLVLALTTPESAREHGWHVAALVTVGEAGDDQIMQSSGR